MKKVVLAVVALCFGFAASAQVTVGGNLGIALTQGSGSTTTTLGSLSETIDKTIRRSGTININPKVGYKLGENDEVGLYLGYSFDRSCAKSPNSSDRTYQAVNHWRVAPYYRYSFANMGKFRFFSELSVPFEWQSKIKDHVETGSITTDTKLDKTAFAWGIALTPGVTFQAGKHCSLDLYIDLLSIGYKHVKKVDNTASGVEDIDKLNVFYTGLNSYNNVLGVNNSVSFRIGYSYTF